MNHEPSIDRKTYIGGSDVAALCGADPYASPLTVYNRKLGLEEKEPPSIHMIWGRNVEDAIASTYRETSPVEIWLGAAGVTQPHPLFPFLRGSYDRTEKTSAKAAPHAVIECKWAGLRQSHKWSDPDADAKQVPVNYFLQAMYYCGLLGLPEVVIVAKQAWRDELAVYRFPFSAETFDAMVEVAARFWMDHVLAKVPPPPEIGKSTQDDLVRLYPEGTGEAVPATEELEAMWERAVQAYKDKKKADEFLREFKTAVQFQAADASVVEFSGGAVKIVDKRGAAKWKDVAAQFADLAGVEIGSEKWNEVVAQFTGKSTRYVKLPFDGDGE